jgi:hypothetical protein
MKRDWELIRTVLARVEASPDLGVRLFADRFPEWPAEAVNYHLWLLIQSGLVTGRCNAEEPRAGFVCYGVALTWAGHEFLAAVRTDTAWARIKTRLQDKAIDLSFEAIVAAARQALGGG